MFFCFLNSAEISRLFFADNFFPFIFYNVHIWVEGFALDGHNDIIKKCEIIDKSNNDDFCYSNIEVKRLFSFKMYINDICRKISYRQANNLHEKIDSYAKFKALTHDNVTALIITCSQHENFNIQSQQVNKWMREECEQKTRLSLFCTFGQISRSKYMKPNIIMNSK